MNIFLKFVYVFLVTILYSFGLVQATFVMQTQAVSTEMVATEANTYKLLMPTYAKKALPIIVAQADTNFSNTTQKVVLEKIKNDFITFFDLYWNNHALISFSIGYDSYKRFLNSFKPLTIDGIKVEAHHIRYLIKSTKKLLANLTEYIQYVHFMGHTDEQIKALLVLEDLCQQLLQNLLKEGYFLPSRTAEIFKDLLIYRTTELMVEHKAITAGLALIVWEFIGRKFDPEHKKSYSQPLTSLKEVFFKKPGPGSESQLSASNQPANDQLGNFSGNSTRDPRPKIQDLVAELREPYKTKNKSALIPNVPQGAILGQIDGIGTVHSIAEYYDSKKNVCRSLPSTPWLTKGFVIDDKVELFEQTSETALSQFKHANSCGLQGLWNSYCTVSFQDRLNEKAHDDFIEGGLLLLPALYDGNFIDTDFLKYLIEDGSEAHILSQVILDRTIKLNKEELAALGKDLVVLNTKNKNKKDKIYLRQQQAIKNQQSIKIRQLAQLEKEDKKWKIRLSEEGKAKIAAFKEKMQIILRAEQLNFAVIGEAERNLLTNYFRDKESGNNGEAFHYFKNREAFLRGIPQTFVMNINLNHWINITVELVQPETGIKKPKVTVYDSMGGAYKNHPMINTIVYFLTEGTEYQVHTTWEHQEAAAGEILPLSKENVLSVFCSKSEFTTDVTNLPEYKLGCGLISEMLRLIENGKQLDCSVLGIRKSDETFYKARYKELSEMSPDERLKLEKTIGSIGYTRLLT